MKKNILIYMISPTHVISSFAALKSLHKEQDVAVTVLVYHPGARDDALVEEIGGVTKEMAKWASSFVKKVLIISPEKLSSMLSVDSITKACSALKEEIGCEEFQEIYYSHDVVGQMYQFLCTTYPNARRICFGDALGNVYERHIHLSYLRGRTNPIKILISVVSRVRQTLGKIIGRLRLSIKHVEADEYFILKDFKPHLAALILPVDQSGNFLKDIQLTICQKETVLDIINQCATSDSDLQCYIKEILDDYQGREKFLLLTDNFAEGNFIDFDREIAMWYSMIKDNCPPNSVIFLKSHPLETLPRNDRIRDELSGLYEVVELDKKFRRYPIEIWDELVRNCKVICFSYPVLSLKYLYDIDVIQPMDIAFIEKWFPEWTWASYKNSLSLYMEPLKRLKDWDGNSVLWAGKV